MEPRDPRPSPTVFDSPPRETEALAAQEADQPASTLGGSMDMPEGATEERETMSALTRPDTDKAAQLGLGARDAGALAAARHANLRRTSHFAKLMAVTFLANLLVMGVAGWWLKRRLESGMEARLGSAQVATPPTSVAKTDPVAATGTATAEIKQMEGLLKADAEKHKSELDGLLRRLADTEDTNRRQTAKLEELTAALSAAKTAPDQKKSTSGIDATISSVAPPNDPLSPTQSELVLLKERNKLTGYADETIATGARTPYERLWETLDDPRLTNLTHAARAEILRVQNFYLGGSRIERYDIPVATYFPEEGTLRDSQLKDSQLIKLLQEKKNPWEVRMKAANLLGTRHSMEVGDTLVEAVKNDDNLDVVKEATFSFEQLTGYHARIFDAASMEQWWKQYKATPPPPQPKAKAAPAKAKTDGSAAKDTKSGGNSAEPKAKEKGATSKKKS